MRMLTLSPRADTDFHLVCLTRPQQQRRRRRRRRLAGGSASDTRTQAYTKRTRTHARSRIYLQWRIYGEKHCDMLPYERNYGRPLIRWIHFLYITASFLAGGALIHEM